MTVIEKEYIMFDALHIAATGMKVQQRNVDNISHNLANANTTGFKKSQLEFQDLLYLHKGNMEGQASPETQISAGFQVGTGARAVANLKTFSQGHIRETNRELDIAIQGDGFFQLRVGEDQQLRYTRDGSFKIDAQKRLVTSQGYLVEPAITLPENTLKVYIGRDGEVSVTIAGQDEMQVVGQLTLARFPNPSGLSSEGSNMFKATDASGEAIVNNPEAEGNGSLLQNTLESSNVNVVDEMVRLITAQRAYEVNSKIIRTGDEMLSMANNLVR